MQIQNLQDVFNHELQDMYSAEQQIIEALPLMAQNAKSPELKNAFTEHLKQTEEQINRLKEVGDKLGVKLEGKKCKGMEGLLKESSELLKMEPSDAVDAALISAAQRVEHYEIAAYGSAVTFAKMLHFNDAEKLLKLNIDEEEREDKLLSKIAQTKINRQALD